jgi:hypothetical protein
LRKATELAWVDVRVAVRGAAGAARKPSRDAATNARANSRESMGWMLLRHREHPRTARVLAGAEEDYMTN